MKISRHLNANAREACGKRVGAHDEERIKALVLAGRTNASIAEELNFSRATITRTRAKLGLGEAKFGRPSTKLL